jgi:hypothetical protein
VTNPTEKKNSSSSPGEITRLLWVWLTILSPTGAVAYVWMYELKDGNQEALVHVLSILAVSMVIILISVVAFPLLVFNGTSIKRGGQFNLFMALVDTIIIVILLQDQSSAAHACELGATCRTYPVRWFALAGMHYCYAIWAYGTMLIHDR